MSRRNRLLRALLLVGALAGALAGVAFATGLVGGAGTIHACVEKKDGDVRIVSQQDRCKRHEPPLDWSQTGPPGPPGQPGPAGTARGYAHVTGGTLDAARSRGVVAMTRFFIALPGPPPRGVAVYCFDLTFVPVNAVAGASFKTGDSLFLGGPEPKVTVAGEPALAAMPCPPGTDAAASVVEEIGTFSNFFLAWT